MMAESSVKIAIVGLGNVGTGVARILTENPDRIRRRSGRSVEIRHAVVRDVHRTRDITLPAGVLTNDIKAAITDPEVDIVVQLMGGTDSARDTMITALDAGKDVVTANKALLCEHGTELFVHARSAGRTIAFEAAVAGGIPIVAAVGQSLAANQITSIQAILNGTSNYILTEMLARGRSYADVLQEAQELGYAEADPAMDVDGTDAAQKLSILVQLAFGTKVDLNSIQMQGIDRLQLADLRYADELGYTVKLLAVARLVSDQLEMHVQPTLIRSDRPIAQTNGAFNIIALKGDAIGPAWFAGPGAGQMPTASAVVADVIEMISGRSAISFERLDLWRDSPAFTLRPAEQTQNRFYLHFNIEDRPHVLADIADILGRNEISIASVMQHESPELDDQTASARVPLVIMTHKTTEGRLRAADEELSKSRHIETPYVRMPCAG
jgi:homoserine dehydrogenase